GIPQVDESWSAPVAYQLVQKLDENGNPQFDPTGQPVLEPRLNSTPRYAQRFALPFGGNIQAIGTVELIFPMPLIEDQSQVRSSFFIDGGNVFSSYCTAS